MDTEFYERLILREIIENWAIWRDTANWKEFRSLWHDDGVMSATMFQGPVNDFIKQAQESHEKGIRAQHVLGGSSINVVHNRATAQTRATIGQRAKIHKVICDVICTIQFVDLFEKRDEKWGLVFRQGVYEKDRLDPVDTSKTVILDKNILAKFPEGYCHLAYLQTNAGLDVKTDMPGSSGPEFEALIYKMKNWI